MNAFASGQGNATVGNGILQASYTNLPPGEYTFKVAASDNQLQWNDNKDTRHHPRSLVENDYRLRSVYGHRVTDCLSKHPPLYLSDQEKDETAT